MMAVVRPEDLPGFIAVTSRWDVEATVMGEVTEGGRLVVLWHGETIIDVPPRSVAHDGPVYERPFARPAALDGRQKHGPDHLPRPSTDAELGELIVRMTGSPNLSSRAWVTDQYDRYVQGNTTLAMPDDAGVIRVDEASGLGVAIATDCNSRFAALDPYAGAQLALAEAYRNVAVTGAKPLAVTDCLNFGSPEDPGVMWQFAEAVRGLADGCQQLGIPVTGGNVSLYNQTGTTPIHPTPVVGVLGVMQDVARRTSSGWREPGAQLFLLGATRPEFGGSEWAWSQHQHLGGLPPTVDLEAERSLADLLHAVVNDGLLLAAHDLSDGGLAHALVESSLRYGVGASVSIEAACARDGVDAFTVLFSESTARAVVAVRPEAMQAFTQACESHEVPVVALGASGGDALTISGRFTLPLEELRAAHTATLPAALNA
jgi:phosphoribosylformylglycinamidine synthase